MTVFEQTVIEWRSELVKTVIDRSIGKYLSWEITIWKALKGTLASTNWLMRIRINKKR